jgi:hypothetical protein
MHFPSCKKCKKNISWTKIERSLEKQRGLRRKFPTKNSILRRFYFYGTIEQENSSSETLLYLKKIPKKLCKDNVKEFSKH